MDIGRDALPALLQPHVKGDECPEVVGCRECPGTGDGEGAWGSGLLGVPKVLGCQSREGCHTWWWCLGGRGCPGCGEGLLLPRQWAQVG